MAAKRATTCLQCLHAHPAPRLLAATPSRGISSSLRRAADAAETPKRSATAPKPIIDIRHIRQNPELYARNCTERNYLRQADHPARIVKLFEQWKKVQSSARMHRENVNYIEKELQRRRGDREAHITRARRIRRELERVEREEAACTDEIAALAAALPNLTSENTPRGDEPHLLSYINEAPAEGREVKSHVDIGTELGILDFASAGTASGWGFYYLLNEGAQLEHALTQYALSVAARRGWGRVSPPTMVYDFIAEACGFQPRDQHGEQQVYGVARSEEDVKRGKPGLCLAGTSEISLAGMKAGASIPLADLPIRRVASSRCFRAEAGARGVDTKGLYRVHEFTKVELFAWTPPDAAATDAVLDDILAIQTEILRSLGLRCRVLEMPSTDLGASATRKLDIEAFFPSRRDRNDGWGEVTSASVCSDYQARRLGTRARDAGGKVGGFPWTVNGTAVAVPRVLAAVLESGWDGSGVVVPECLRPWMDGVERIGK